jgi:hypothetical protein
MSVEQKSEIEMLSTDCSSANLFKEQIKTMRLLNKLDEQNEVAERRTKYINEELVFLRKKIEQQRFQTTVVIGFIISANVLFALSLRGK